MIACILSTASMVPGLYERSGVAADGSPLAGLGLALFVAFAALVLHAIVGRILALYLSRTRCEISILDCTAFEAQALDDQVIWDELMLRSPLAGEITDPQQRIFEWVDTQSEAEFMQSMRG